MSKYEPLKSYLQSRHPREIRMSFAEIEAVIGDKLPEKSKAHRAWWSNNPSNSVMTKAWLAAGYRSALVDVAGEKVTFVPSNHQSGFGEKEQAPFDTAKPASRGGTRPSQKPVRHPAFGVWKGKVTLLPDYDYTRPADPDWGRVYED